MCIASNLLRVKEQVQDACGKIPTQTEFFFGICNEKKTPTFLKQFVSTCLECFNVATPL